MVSLLSKNWGNHVRPFLCKRRRDQSSSTQHISLTIRTDTYNYKLSDTYYQIVKLGNTRRNQTALSTVVLCLGQKKEIYWSQIREKEPDRFLL